MSVDVSLRSKKRISVQPGQMCLMCPHTAPCMTLLERLWLVRCLRKTIKTLICAASK